MLVWLPFPGKLAMHTTITLDGDLVTKAQNYTGITDTSALMRAALNALIEREASRRLAVLGSSQPGATAAPRRR